jgi:hypothetical protein
VFSAKREGARANLIQNAACAVGLLGGADSPTMPDEQVGYLHPLVFRDDLHQVLLNFVWVAFFA